MIAGSASLLASLTIIWIIWRDRYKKLKVVYHRLLFAISVLDVVISLNFAFSFLAIPEGMFWGAQGNTASCEASGFLQILYTSQGLYNLGLAVYYLMIIRYGKSQEFVSRFIEPYVHAVSLCLPIGFGCWAIVVDALNPYPFLGSWCGVNAYPQGCAEIGNGDCIRGEMASTIKFALGIGMIFPSLIGVAAIMIMIVCHVRGQRASVTQYDTRPQLDRTVIQTVRQAMLYIWASLIPCAVIVTSLFVQGTEQIPRLLLALLTTLILPLQGVFNLIIYVRPRYIALRQRRGDSLSFFTMMQYIIFGEKSLASQADQLLDDLAPEVYSTGGVRRQVFSPDPNDEVESDASNRDAENVRSNAEED